MAEDLGSVLNYLADLAPARAASLEVTVRRSDFVLLDWRRLQTRGGTRQLVAGDPPPAVANTRRGRAAAASLWEAERAAAELALPIHWTASDEDLDRLAGLDELHHAERLLRLGWMFLVGTVEVDGDARRVFLPLASAPVELEDGDWEGYRLTIEADLGLPVAIEPGTERDRLEEGLEGLLARTFADRPLAAGSLVGSPTLGTWGRAVAAGLGLPAPRVLGPDADPFEHRAAEGLVVCTGMAVYLARDLDAPSVAGTLRGWASQDVSGSALAAIYGSAPPPEAPPPTEEGVGSPFPLNRRQLEALARAGREVVTVVSGPPGTGKSHLVAAMAVDEVARGRSVLVATQSDYAADIIGGMLDRAAGPRFVQFGRRSRRVAVADELTAGLAVPFGRREIDQLTERQAEARRRQQALRAQITALLERERAAAEGLAKRPGLAWAEAQAPGALDEGLDWHRVQRLLGATQRSVLGGWGRRRAERRLRRLVRARRDATREDVRLALDAGRAERAVRRGLAGGGVTLSDLWDRLEQADAALRTEIGGLVEARRRSRQNSKRDSNRAVAGLASALRAGRVQRRRMLRNLRAGDFLDVLPLWLGTLTEIDDTLPVEPGAFDVVIFDEASQIDQLRAAPALARARRAVVVGDPRQLRHVSFVSDDAMEQAARRRGIGAGLGRLLDVRRNSLFDAATGAAPVTWLEEHYRSVPHIIGFSADRFYDRRLRLMTQHPGTETRDAIRVVRVPGGRRDERGFNMAELDAVRAEVRNAMDAGAASIGVVSPFRAQADRLEGMLVVSFTGAELRRYGVRVGTVHAFQGNEREVIVASLAIGADETGQPLRFLQDPNLFNVLVTRAQREMVVVTSVDPDDLPAGLFADYLRYAHQPPLPSETARPPSGWVGELAASLAGYRVPYVADYPVGGWTVDLAVGAGEAAVGVECVVHPDGAETHIERHLALRRAGWRMTDAFQTRWLAKPEAATAEVARQVLATRPQARP